MSDISNFIQGQITRKKIEKGLEMLHNESPAELKKRLQNVDMNEILQKMDEYDKSRLQELGINVNELKGSVSESDILKIQQVLGRDGERVIRKLRNMLR
jgi:Mg/Co/Ni transporter MgtE